VSSKLECGSDLKHKMNKNRRVDARGFNATTQHFKSLKKGAKLTRPCARDRSWRTQKTARICPARRFSPTRARLHARPPLLTKTICESSSSDKKNKKYQTPTREGGASAAAARVTDCCPEPLHMLLQRVFVAGCVKFNVRLTQVSAAMHRR